jgi:hypothetical protein
MGVKCAPAEPRALHFSSHIKPYVKKGVFLLGSYATTTAISFYDHAIFASNYLSL